MAEVNDPNAALAVLIDADNASAAMVDGLLAEVATLGVARVKRIYGDWTAPNLNGWKQVLLEHSIQPIQQFRYTVGKNATDSAMIIDAMDLLYGDRFSGFCIVSSDSDFTRLATPENPEPVEQPAQSMKMLRANTALLQLIRAGIASASDDDGWATLSAVGSYMNKTSADFDPRNYGYQKLSALVAAIGLFEAERRGTPIHVRDSRKKPPGE